MRTEESTLVFPAGMPSSLAFAYQANLAGRRIVGASSLAFDQERQRYAEWTSLPWVLEPNFKDELTERIRHFDIAEIFTPHPVVWEQINRLLPSLPAGVKLCPREWDSDFASYQRQRDLATEFLQRSERWSLSSQARPPLTVGQIAGLIRLFERTPGQCSHAKVEALMAIYRDVAAGDIVEIGSLFGLSALVFAFLARHYGTGKLLCVDPWSIQEAVQNIKEIDTLPVKKSVQAIFEAFTANLAPWRDITNYLRQPSVAAARTYATSKTVSSPEFGVTQYSGDIAILHIDGNHARRAVADDIHSWMHLVIPGGWIIFDDYRWSFGDGPQTVADEFCRNFERYWSTAFEAGGALFMRLNEQIPRNDVAVAGSLREPSLNAALAFE
jgi:hypothetical protein